MLKTEVAQWMVSWPSFCTHTPFVWKGQSSPNTIVNFWGFVFRIPAAQILFKKVTFLFYDGGGLSVYLRCHHSVRDRFSAGQMFSPSVKWIFTFLFLFKSCGKSLFGWMDETIYVWGFEWDYRSDLCWCLSYSSWIKITKKVPHMRDLGIEILFC